MFLKTTKEKDLFSFQYGEQTWNFRKNTRSYRKKIWEIYEASSYKTVGVIFRTNEGTQKDLLADLDRAFGPRAYAKIQDVKAFLTYVLLHQGMQGHWNAYINGDESILLENIKHNSTERMEIKGVTSIQTWLNGAIDIETGYPFSPSNIDLHTPTTNHDKIRLFEHMQHLSTLGVLPKSLFGRKHKENWSPPEWFTMDTNTC